MTDEPTKPRKPGTFQKGHPGYKPKGALNKINRTTKEALDEAANIVGGKQGKVGVFVKVGEKDIVALGHMLARSMPMEVAAEINNVSAIGEVNIISVPYGHWFCPDGLLRPCAEAEVLWREHKSKHPELPGQHPKLPEPRPEPEVQALIEKAIKRKPDDPA